MNAEQKPYAGNPHVRFDEGLLARASCTAGWGLLDRPWRLAVVWAIRMDAAPWFGGARSNVAQARCRVALRRGMSALEPARAGPRARSIGAP